LVQAALTTVLLIAAIPLIAGAQESGCIVYRHNDELRARCATTDLLIAHKQGLFLYAICGERLAIAVVGRAQDEAPASLTVFSNEGRQRKVLRGYTLYASCGTIMSAIGSGGPDTRSWDALSGQPMSLLGLASPICSDQRKVIIGIDKSGSLSTGSGAVLARRDPPEPLIYGLSPSGEYAAYSNEIGRLCIIRTSGSQPRCYHANAEADGTLAVDNSGRTLFVAASGGPCYYSGYDGQHVSNDGRKSEADACYSIYMASLSAGPKLMVQSGFSPTWTTRRTAENLAKQMRK
jgi:hypothetical protein